MQRLRDIGAPALHFFTWTLRALFPLRSSVRGRGESRSVHAKNLLHPSETSFRRVPRRCVQVTSPPGALSRRCCILAGTIFQF